MAQKQHEWHQHLGGNTDYAELRHLLVELKEVVDWFPLGVQLDIPPYELEAIREDHRTVKSCRLNMLIKWGQLEKPTWSKLIKALNNIGKKRLAKEIAEKYGLKRSSIAEQPLTKTKTRKTEVEPMDETKQGLETEVETATEAVDDIKMEDIQVVHPVVLLGSGSFGCVKKVKYKKEICAAKYFFQRKGMREKAQQEAGILSRLQRFEHKNIVKYFGANTMNDEPVLVMELLRMSLQKYLEENPKVPLLVILRLLHDVSKGLEYLHGENIIHRDLTVTNVLLDDEGVAKVADFGNSCVIEFDSPSTRTFQPGTRLYCAPETVSTVGLPRGPRYAKKIDIYSFGQLSAIVVTKKFPENVDPGNIRSVEEVREIYKHDVKKELVDHPRLLALIESCLSKYHEDRLSASDLQTKLDELYHDEKEKKTKPQAETVSSPEDKPDIL